LLILWVGQAAVYFATSAYMAEWNSLLFKTAHARYLAGRHQVCSIWVR
jgi:hypothetical protein